MSVLLGSGACNDHVHNIALALHEVGLLSAYYTGAVDHYRRHSGRRLRAVLGRSAWLDSRLRQRRIPAIPDHLIHSRWRWDLPRIVSARVGLPRRVQDWLWERSELSLDRRCARRLEGSDIDIFCGLEHGSLRSLSVAQRLGKTGMVTFLSPHPSTRARWVDAEYQRFPELLTPTARRLLDLGRRRDVRRDSEAAMSDFIITNSRFTTRSLVEAGHRAEKIFTVPLGSPPAPPDLPRQPVRRPLRLIYAGPLSVRKGAHYLLDAWRRLGCNGTAELHCYGTDLLPRSVVRPEGVVFHGHVARRELYAAYGEGLALVFPTLCDGFGQVVTEAFAHGVPVITTRNAGAADLIEDGRNGFLIPAGSAEKLAERLEWCLQHPHELVQMREVARETAERWSWGDFRTLLRSQMAGALGIEDGEIYAGTPAGTARVRR